MPPNTFVDPLIPIAMWTAGGVLAFTAMLVLQIAWLRLRLLLRRRRNAHFLACWRPLLLECIDAVPSQLPALSKPDVFAFLCLWNQFQESLRGPARHRLRAVALRLRMDVAARKLLRRGRNPDRLMAMLTLGHLSDVESWQALQQIAAGSHPLLSLTAARAMLLIDGARAMNALLPLISTRADWPLSRLEAMLAEIAPSVASDALVAAVDTTAPQALPRLIALMDVGEADSVGAVVKRMLQNSQNLEILIACLKSRHLPRDRDLVLRLLDHPSWQVRTQAARVLGRFAARGDESALATLLSDPVWWVRYRAAQSLAQLPFLSREDLWQLRERLDDRFASDLLDLVVAEKEMR